MIKAGIALLISGIALSLVSTFLLNEQTPYLNYIQTAGFLIGVIGLFMMERNRVKAKAESRRKQRTEK
ncbi:hypothetical protein [Bacillus sp. 1P06AnD]|uniref:hypothetical protein n=1 Tax=Bacillus sp. 1P06AnD TaxID=3132208 RepID=UPI00399F9898